MMQSHSQSLWGGEATLLWGEAYVLPPLVDEILQLLCLCGNGCLFVPIFV